MGWKENLRYAGIAAAILAGGAVGWFGHSYSSLEKKTSEPVPRQRETARTVEKESYLGKPTWTTSVNGDFLQYYEGVSIPFGKGEIKGNVLIARAGGNTYEFYDYEDSKNIRFNSSDVPVDYNAKVERAAVVLEDGKRYDFDAHMINGGPKSTKAKAWTDKASSVYNVQLGRIHNDYVGRKTREDMVDPAEAFKPLEDEVRAVPSEPEPAPAEKEAKRAGSRFVPIFPAEPAEEKEE